MKKKNFPFLLPLHKFTSFQDKRELDPFEKIFFRIAYSKWFLLYFAAATVSYLLMTMMTIPFTLGSKIMLKVGKSFFSSLSLPPQIKMDQLLLPLAHNQTQYDAC